MGLLGYLITLRLYYSIELKEKMIMNDE